MEIKSLLMLDDLYIAGAFVGVVQNMELILIHFKQRKTVEI